MTSFTANISTIFLRFILMMAAVFIGGFTGQWWIALIALPIFLSAMCGISFTTKKTPERS
ncbi:MAG: hypothetical protein AAFU03_12580 [Bacteroidota bacterium]